MPQSWQAISLLLLLGTASHTNLLEARHSLSTYSWEEGEAQTSQSAIGSAGLYLPLSIRHGVTKERGLLRNGTLPIQGAIREVGYVQSPTFGVEPWSKPGSCMCDIHLVELLPITMCYSQACRVAQ